MENTNTEKNKGREEQIKLLHGFIKTNKLAVMATVAKGDSPEAAVIGIKLGENLELLCSSFSTSRKDENIKLNSKVALVIGWENGKTVQYEGIAEELNIDQGQETELQSVLADVPSIAKYVQREFKVFYKIKPVWVRFSDLSVDPWERFEVKF
jgi:hypothetical protein